ncbi:MAG: CmcI family methyltransferase [Candidatus Korobacteraceae bacterium]
MKYVIDTERQTLTEVGEDESKSVIKPLYSEAAFELISRQWVRTGWSLGYFLAFTWMGQPVLQLPEDLLQLQEIIYQVRPDLIIETGVFKGGSLLYYASLCRALGKGHVVGIDVSIPPEVRIALREHTLAPLIDLVEGPSTASESIAAVTRLRKPDDTIMVVLDSAHTREHVSRELEVYSPFVSPGSYLVVADGIMRDLADVPGGHASWVEDNPALAVTDFLASHPEFVLCPPAGLGARGNLSAGTTYFTDGWLQRLR